MTTQTNAKIRFVRCPKCAVVLQEPDIPLYRCGGCGAVLKAKNLKTNSAKATGLLHGGSDANGKGNGHGSVDVRENNGPSEEAAVSAREESLSVSGSPLPGTGSIRNQASCLNEETTSERGDCLSDAGSNMNQETIGPAGGEPLPGTTSMRKLDNCVSEETISERGKILSDSGSNRNQDNCLNQATPDPAKGEPLPGTGSFRKQDNCLNEDAISERGESVSDVGRNNDRDTCPNQETTTISTGGELPADISNGRQDNNFQNSSGRQSCVESISPPQLSNSLGLGSHEGQELASQSREKTKQVQSDYDADHNRKEYKNEYGDLDRNCLSGRSFSDDFYSSTDLLWPETEDSSSELDPNVGIRETQITSNQDRVAESESENCTRKQTEHSEVPSPIEGKMSDENEFPSKGGISEEGGDNMYLAQHVGNGNGNGNESRFEDHRRKISHDSTSPKQVPSSTEVVPVMVSPVADTGALVDENLRVHNCDSLEKEDSLKKDESGSIDADENLSSGSILSHNVDSSDDEHLGASPRYYTGITGPENMPLGNSGSEFDLKHRELSKSPTKCYYGYEGGDGFGDRIAGRIARPPRRKVKQANYSNGLHNEDGPVSNGSRSGNLEMQYKPIVGSGPNDMLKNEPEVRQQTRKPPILPDKHHPAMKLRPNQDDLHDPRSFTLSFGSRMREDRGEHISSLPVLPVYLQSGQRKANPPPYPVNSFQHYSSFSSADAPPPYAEPDKIELLRMVNELKEELSRMQISNSRFPLTVTREEKYAPLYSDYHLAPVAETSSDLRYSRYPRRYSQEKGFHQLNQVPRMAFSGDAADYMRHVDCECMHCHPQDWHYSAQLPSHTIFCNKAHCMGHSGASYNSFCSTASSPHRYKSSEFSAWDRDTMSLDQRHRESETRNLVWRERYPSMKRHVRPVAGGNPIITCYHCSALLQLPADFLLSGKRCLKLKCSTCGKVLKFSLERGKHIVPFIPSTIAPPPSMVDDSSGYIPRGGNWVSASHSNDNGNLDVEPMSCTDDYGVSFERSISTEGEPSVVIPGLPRNSRSGKISSGDHPALSLEDRKMKSVLDEYGKMATKSPENLGGAETSSSKRSKGPNSSSEIQELAPNGGSPLHRLMGYSSPSAVMKY